ncbi:MAG: nucleotidyltransferase domain-containing protein [Hydrogenophaga sp.]|jgi:predicted nucleotidyltransferase|uniref:nucleotidyltransferase domain-containing protein n=1 Tax=unclassified Hydrogenophaga TaxID=2610897 RepID=UPI0036D2F889
MHVQTRAHPRLSLHQPDAGTQRQAEARLRLGRQEARAIIAAMKKKGVTVRLFGSMKTGQTTPHSDIDLLITDPGPLGAMRAVSETLAERLTIPVDVVAEETIGPDAFARIQDSLNA